jgi:hypothetical protein
VKRENELIAIFGKKGGGKTSIAANFINNLNRLIIFDHNREYERGLFVYNPQQLIDAIKKYHESAFRLIYRFDESMTLNEHADYFFRVVNTIKNFTLLYEEIDRVSGPRFMPVGLDNIVNVGRHKGPARVNRDLTSNADRIYIAGPLNEPNDINYLAEFVGSDCSEKLRQLNREEGKGSEFLEWTQESVKIGFINFLTKEINFDNIPTRLKNSNEPSKEAS